MSKKIAHLTVLATILGALPAFAAPPDDGADIWPMYQNNAAHNGYQPFFVGDHFNLLTWKTRFRLVSGPCLDLNDQPVIGGNLIYLTDRCASKYAVAVDLDKGTPTWRMNFGIPTTASGPAYQSLVPVCEEPARSNNGCPIGHGLLYLQTAKENENSLYRIYDSANGNPLFQTGDDQVPTIWGSFLSPTLFQGAVYFPNPTLGGVDSFTVYGSRRWSANASAMKIAVPSVNAQHVITYAQGSLIAQSRVTGQQDFVVSVPYAAVRRDIDPQAPALGTYENALFTDSGRLISVDLANRRIAWTAEGEHMGQVSVANGVAYSRDGNHSVVARDETDGRLLWRWTAPSPEWLRGNLVVTDSHVFLSGLSRLFGIAVSTGQTDWQYNLSGQIVVTRNALVVATDQGDIYKLMPGVLDDNPENSDFGHVYSTALNNLQYSKEVTLANINSIVPISIDNGEYSVNGQPPTRNSGLVQPGDKIVAIGRVPGVVGQTNLVTIKIGSGTFPFQLTAGEVVIPDRPFGASAQASGTANNLTLEVTATPPTALEAKMGRIYIATEYQGGWTAYNGTSWIPWTGGAMASAFTGLLTTKNIPVFRGSDLSATPGLNLYVGMGTSLEDMLARGSYKLVYTVN